MGSAARNLLGVLYGVMAALTNDDPVAVLDAIGGGLGFDAGTFWEVDRRGVLASRVTWSRDGHARSFAAATQKIVFACGDGIPGKVWASRKICWTADLAADPAAGRHAAAIADGLTQGLWFPVLSASEVLGVIELMRRAGDDFDPDLFDGLLTIGRAVGLYLGRVRAEREHINRELESRVDLATRALVESERQLRALADRIQTVREEERTDLAREIHDVLGQELTGLKLDAGWISRRLAERTEVSDPVVERTQAMIRNIDATIGAVRRISAALRPRVLDDLGLIAAAECFAREISERSSIAVVVTAPDELPLPAPLATAVYRILQELVTNAVRHADAHRIEIGIAVGDGAIELRVVDDGKGLVPASDRTEPSLGLIGIRERARTFGGALAIGSRAGGGTEATVRIPVDEARR